MKFMADHAWQIGGRGQPSLAQRRGSMEMTRENALPLQLFIGELSRLTRVLVEAVEKLQSVRLHPIMQFRKTVLGGCCVVLWTTQPQQDAR